MQNDPLNAHSIRSQTVRVFQRWLVRADLILFEAGTYFLCMSYTHHIHDDKNNKYYIFI